MLRCELETPRAAQELLSGEEEPSAQVWYYKHVPRWSSRGEWLSSEEELSRRRERSAAWVPEGQDASLCTATVMLSCFWIMIFLEQEKEEELTWVGNWTGVSPRGCSIPQTCRSLHLFCLLPRAVLEKALPTTLTGYRMGLISPSGEPK